MNEHTVPTSGKRIPTALYRPGRCPTCDGDGSVECYSFDPSVKEWREPCDNCKATGRAPWDWQGLDALCFELNEAIQEKNGDAVDAALKKLTAAMGWKMEKAG